MRLRASLFKIQEKRDVYGKDIYLPIESVIAVPEHLYPDEIELGDEKTEWIFKTHCRDKNYDHGFLYLGFEIVNLDQNEQECEFEIKEAIFDENGQCSEYVRLHRLVTSDGKEVYIDIPVVSISVKDGGRRIVDYKTSRSVGALTCTVGSVYAGYARLCVYKKHEEKPYRSLPKILILPSSVSLADFTEMANDLFEIRSNLIMEEKGKTYITRGMSYQIEAINDSLIRLKGYLQRINASPALGLKDGYSKIYKNRIKKGRSEVWIDMAIYPHKKKFDVPTKEETTNIYENRVIKSALIKIKNMLEKIQTGNIANLELMERMQNIARNGSNASAAIKDYLKSRGEIFIPNEKSEKLILRLKSYKEKKEVYKQKLKEKKREQILRLMSSGWHPFTDVTINCILHKNGYLKPEVIINNECIELRIDGGSTYVNRNYGLDTKYGKYYFNTLPGSCEFESRKIILSFKSNNILYIEKLRRAFCEAPVNCNINIHGDSVRKNYIDYGNPLWIGKYESEYPKYVFEIVNLNELTFNNEPVGLELTVESLQGVLDSIVNYDKEVLRVDDEIANCEERIETLQSFVDKYNDLSYLKNRYSEKIANSSSNVKYLSALPFLKGVDEIKFDWKPTQIFTRHNCYKPVFDILRELDNNVKFTIGFDGKSFAVQKVDQIYEYWCFYKFIDILTTKMGWKFINNESKGIISILNDYLFGEEQHNKKIKKGQARKELIPVKLYFPNEEHEITLDIFHEKRFEASTAKSDNLLPDYQFVFEVDGKKSYFYIDAKYYKFGEMNHYNPLNVVRDLIQDVAIENYISGFENFEHHSSASFIVHSDDSSDNYINWGGDLDDEVFKNLNNQDQIYKPHMCGAFYFLPGKIECFTTYIRMLMEYHLEMYGICWACGNSHKGSSGVEREVRLTSSGYEKYYFKCGNCKDFWVKTHCDSGSHHNLIKHFEGYHKAEAPWFVKCPKCDLEKHKI